MFAHLIWWNSAQAVLILISWETNSGQFTIPSPRFNLECIDQACQTRGLPRLNMWPVGHTLHMLGVESRVDTVDIDNLLRILTLRPLTP